MIVCDFCSSHKVKWEFPCEDFQMPQMDWGSENGWAACDECKDLIEADDWDALAQRALDTTASSVLRQYPGLEISLFEHYYALHLQFRKHRKGKVLSFG